MEEKVSSPEVKVIGMNASGLGLLDYLQGFDRAIIIDAIQTAQGKVGEVYRLSLEDLTIPSQSPLTHNIDLPTAIKLGQQLDLPLPQEIILFAVEVEEVAIFSKEWTPKVKEAIPKVVEVVLDELKLH